MTKLKARFEAVDHRERFACQLRTLKRQPNQSLQNLYNEVRKLMALAYPRSADSELSEIIARDAFLSALGDRELEIKVRDREPGDLDSAFKAAVRIEAYLRAGEGYGFGEREGCGRRERMDGHRARAVKGPNEETPGETVLREMKAQLDKSLKAQEELSKELSRIRILAEARAERGIASGGGGGWTARDDRGRDDNRKGERPRRGCYECGDAAPFVRECPVRHRDRRPPPAAQVEADNSRGSEEARQVRRLDSNQLERAAYLRMRVSTDEVDVFLDTGSEVLLVSGKIL
jgi:hypothetical protein